MDKSQILALALGNVLTIITVLIGILLNNGRLGCLAGLEHKLDTRFDLLLSEFIGLDNRLTRIEAQPH